jgi:cation diffusion facilitator CzcD-associated flavoprotein CzcO
VKHTQLLVIGAGPYALSAAALAREQGIQTMVLGRPMGFWRQNMPEGMFLRSGPDWHLDLVRFDDMAGARVLIIGGRQSAYEWAALIREHGAAHIDIVHRHDIPRFERVSWKFVDPHVEQTLRVRGYWRNLPGGEQQAISRRFWEVGRLTLEHWLAPRLDAEGITRWPGAEVIKATPRPDGQVRVLLSNGVRLAADRVVLATGYRADLSKVPYLAGVLEEVKLSGGFPVLDEAFQTSLDGL